MGQTGCTGPTSDESRWARLMEGNQLLLTSRGDEARAIFLKVWDEATANADHFCACAVAHMLGVMEPHPPEWKLRWQRAALEHAELVRDGRVDGWYPSLYINLGKVYRLLDQPAEAIRCYELAEARVKALDASPYVDVIRANIEKVLVELRTMG